MKKNVLQIMGALLLTLLLPLMSSCNDEDDVVEILTGKTWKMTRLTENNKHAPQFYNGIWNNEMQKNRSMEILQQDGTFTVVFEGSEINGEVDGQTIRIQGSSSNAEGKWKANGKDNTLTLHLRVRGSETDPLAKAFMNAMQNVFQYEGDINQLTLYYKDKDIVRKIGFAPVK